MSPTATVSADKMNVFYIGVDNPVSISVPGVPNDRVRASITNGTIIPKGNGKYIVRVSQGTKSVVNVTAEMNGKMMSMGSAEFRVKRVPDVYKRQVLTLMIFVCLQKLNGNMLLVVVYSLALILGEVLILVIIMDVFWLILSH